MLFQTLDEKQDCVAVFLNGALVKDKIPENITKTWSYSSFLEDKEIEYASLYCIGKTFDDMCPDELRPQWDRISHKLKAYYRSFLEAKVSLDDNCFFDLVPEQFLLEFCDIKNQLTDHVFKTCDKPENYDFLLDLTKLLTDIKYRKLNVNSDYLKDRLSEYKVRQFYKKLDKIDFYIRYNIDGTKTGRLTTKKSSFPILTMDKTYRGVLKPNNDWFVELDYNAAELRTLLALTGKDQPLEDLHAWNAKNVYKDLLTREEAKKKIFAWLYNPNSTDHLSNSVYQRDAVLKKYWDGKQVQTIYDRIIPADRHHALNYIIQSTFSDLLLRQAIKVANLLKNKKTHIAFIVHDSIILDMAAEDESMINDIYNEFSNTSLGRFKTRVCAGKNFGDLKELWIRS